MNQKKRICWLLVISLLSSVLAMPTPSYADERTYGNEEPQRIRELTELRERNSETWQLSDGSFEAVVYAGNKYYPAENGEMEPIDASIVPVEYSEDGIQYSFTNAANEWHVFFSNQGSVLLENARGDSLAFSLAGMQSSGCTLGGIGLGEELGLELQGENCLQYLQAFDNVDIVYRVTDYGVKEYIVLYSADVPMEYSFSVCAGNAEVAIRENGELLFGDEEDGFLFGSLYIVDGNGEISKSAVYELNDHGDEVSIELDPAVLSDPDTVFPLIIDPTVTLTGSSTTFDSFVSSKYASTNYNSGSEMNYLWTGKNSLYNVCRSYIKFTLPSTLTSSYYVTNADLRIEKYAGSIPKVRALRVGGSWTSSGITWNNKPSGYTTGQSAVMTGYTGYSGNWYRTDVTNTVSMWVRGVATNYGFILKDNTEDDTSQFTTFYSSDSSSPHKPELHITYFPHADANIFYYTTTLGPGTTQSIATLLSQEGYSTQRAYDVNAPHDRVLYTLEHKRIFHILTHGLPGRIDVYNGGILYANEITQVSSDLKMVFFESCYSAVNGGSGYGRLDTKCRSLSDYTCISIAFSDTITASNSTDGIHAFALKVYQYLAQGYTASQAVIQAKAYLLATYGTYYGSDYTVVGGQALTF